MNQSLSLDHGDTITARLGTDVYGQPVVRLNVGTTATGEVAFSLVLDINQLCELANTVVEAEAMLRRAIDKIIATPHEPAAATRPVAA